MGVLFSGVRELELKDEQKTSLDKLEEPFQSDNQDLGNELRALHTEAVAGLKAGKVDMTKVQPHYAAIDKLLLAQKENEKKEKAAAEARAAEEARKREAREKEKARQVAAPKAKPRLPHKFTKMSIPEIEKAISRLEEELANLEASFGNPRVAANPQAMKELQNKYDAGKKDLADHMAAWEVKSEEKAS